MQSIILHVGAGKTGTSAIQTALARLHEKLFTKGIYYPSDPSFIKAAKGEASSGNAGTLMLFAKKKLPVNQEDKLLRDWITQIISESKGQTILVSSEALSYGEFDQFVKIKKIFLEKGLRPKIIYYVRHLADLAISGYGQFAKHGLVTHDLELALARFRAPFREQLEMFVNIFGREAVEVRLYDEEKDDLVNRFLKYIGIDDLPVTIEKVNRSFSRSELEIMRRLARVGAPFAVLKELTSYIMYECDNEREPFTLTQAELDDIESRNTDVIEYVNNTFFGSIPRLQIRSSELQISSREECSLQGRDLMFLKILESAVETPREKNNIWTKTRLSDLVTKMKVANPALFYGVKSERQTTRIIRQAFQAIDRWANLTSKK